MSIVMVTNLKEGAKSKCEQYWPNCVMESEEFGPYTVTLLDEQVSPDYTIRSLSVTVSESIYTPSPNLLSYRYRMDLMKAIQ